MTVKEFADKSGCEIVTAKSCADREITNGYMCDLLSYVIGRAESGCAWITIMTNVNVVAVATLADVSCVIVPENNFIDEDTRKKAENNDIVMLKTSLTAFGVAAQLAKCLGV